jgi:hypothetical protein
VVRRPGRTATSTTVPNRGSAARRISVARTSYACVGRTMRIRRPITAKGCFASIWDVSSSSTKSVEVGTPGAGEVFAGEIPYRGLTLVRSLS